MLPCTTQCRQQPQTQAAQGPRALTVAQVPATEAPGWSLRHAPLQQWAFLRQPNLDAAMHCVGQAGQAQVGGNRQTLGKEWQSSGRSSNSAFWQVQQQHIVCLLGDPVQCSEG